MSYDDPNQYAHTDKNEHDRELDRRDRAEEKGPKFLHVPPDADVKVRFLDGTGDHNFKHLYPHDNDPED